MRTIAFSLAAAIVFAGAARATDIVCNSGDICIREAITGTIISGIDSANLFGGGDLAGQTATFIFAYDWTAVEAAISAGADGSVLQSIGNSALYWDKANDNALGTAVSINGTEYWIGNSNSPGESFGLLNDSMNQTSGTWALNVVNQLGSQPYMSMNFYASSPVATGLSTQASVDSFMALATGASVGITAASGTGENLVIGNLETGTPEPSTWGPLVFALGGLTLLKRARKR